MGNEYQRFLMHHGVKGQEWGVRNGPPYPLKPNQRSAAEKEAEGGTQGSVALVAAYAATTVALAVAPRAIISTVREISARKADKDAKEKSNDKKYASERENEEIDPETGLYLTGKKMTEEENMERINPSFDSGNIAFKVNCTACTMAMELRERGYDVHAGTDGKKLIKDGGTTDAYRSKNWYTGESPYDSKKIYRTTQKGIDKFKSDMANEPNSRGELCFTWKLGGGHSVFYKTDSNGKPTVYDTQSGKKMSDNDLSATIKNSVYIDYTRLDNSTPNIQYLKDNNYIC